MTAAAQPLSLQVGGRGGCTKFATYPASCGGAVTLKRRVPGNVLQHWLLQPQGGGASYALRPALCQDTRLAFSEACNAAAAQLLPDGQGLGNWSLTKIVPPR